MSNKVALLIIASLIMTYACVHDPLGIDEPIVRNPIDSLPDDPMNFDKACNPDSVYFVNEIFPIFKSNCAISGCHGDGSAEDGVDLTSYSSIIKTAEVRPFNLKESKIWEVITETDPDKIMPLPPALPLSNDQILKIEKWINQGASNNQCGFCDLENVTFSGKVSGIIQDNCQGCHSGSNPSGGLSLVSYNDIKSIADNGRLLGVIAHQTGYVAMPFNQEQLPDCQIDQIEIWISNGTLND